MNIRYACPNCRARLDSGLRCPDCGFLGVWRDGLLFLHRNDASWDRCIIERNGWISRTKEVGLYRENDDHFFLPDQRPHLKQVYAESKAHIDTFMRAEDLNGRLCVDLGASIGWVEAYVLKTYPLADLIALEINDDRFCGLGRSLVLKEQLGIEFTSLVADMHHIPLCDESVDIVFSVDALHHFRDMGQVFNEVHRVLRPGGKFYGINEPDRPSGTDETAYVATYASMELQHNIIERRPTYAEYIKAGGVLDLHSINAQMGLVQHVDTASLLLKGEKARHS